MKTDLKLENLTNEHIKKIKEIFEQSWDPLNILGYNPEKFNVKIDEVKTAILEEGKYEIFPTGAFDGRVIINEDDRAYINIQYKINSTGISQILARVYQGQEKRFEIEMRNHFYGAN